MLTNEQLDRLQHYQQLNERLTHAVKDGDVVEVGRVVGKLQLVLSSLGYLEYR